LTTLGLISGALKPLKLKFYMAKAGTEAGGLLESDGFLSLKSSE